MRKMTRSARWILPLLVLGVAPACLAVAAGAAAGAAGAVAYTERGASSLVKAPVDQVVQRTEAVFADLGIQVESRSVEEDGSEVDLNGETEDLEVTVEIERDTPGTTEVEVYARENLVEWDREYARMVLERIIAER